MFKFRLLLWGLAVLMKRTAKRNPKFQDKIKDEHLAFQIQTEDNKAIRHYKIDGLNISSASEVHPKPDFSIIFCDAQTGFAIMTNKDKNAFMRSIQDKQTRIEGNLARVLWFQGIIKYLSLK